MHFVKNEMDELVDVYEMTEIGLTKGVVTVIFYNKEGLETFPVTFPVI